VFRYHKINTNEAKDKLGEKLVTILFVLIAFNFFGRFNIIHMIPISTSTFTSLMRDLVVLYMCN